LNEFQDGSGAELTGYGQRLDADIQVCRFEGASKVSRVDAARRIVMGRD